MNDDFDDEPVAGPADLTPRRPRAASKPVQPVADAVTESEAVMAQHRDDLSDTDLLLRELRRQNELLSRLVINDVDNVRSVSQWRRIHAVAVGVFLGVALVWGVAQTNWGAKHFAVPVKFFVDQQTATEIGIDPTSESGVSGRVDPTSSDDRYDDYCPPGETFTENYDYDCPVE